MNHDKFANYTILILLKFKHLFCNSQHKPKTQPDPTMPSEQSGRIEKEKPT